MATAVNSTVNGRAKVSAGEGAAPVTTVAHPVKLRRRPVLVAAGAAATVLGALLGVWAWTATTSTREVVAVRAAVARGEVIERADLMTVQVGVDPALRPLPAGDLPGLVGQRAAVDLEAGGLVTSEAVGMDVLPPDGMSVVGVSLPDALLPGEPLLPGDAVRVVATPGQQGEVAAGTQWTLSAEVVGVRPDVETGQTLVSVMVSFDEAPELAARAASGRVVVVLDSRER